MAEPAPVAQAPQAWGIQVPSIGWAGQIGAARTALQQALADRETADLRVSYMWIALFFLAPIVQSALFLLAFVVGVLSLNLVLLLVFGLIALLTPVLIHGVINRTLIRRMTRHFERENRLRGALIEYLHAKAAEEKKLDAAAGSLLAMAMIHGEALAYDRGRSVYWSFAVSLPGIRWYFFWFISKFPYEHEQRWVRFLRHAETAARSIGVPFAVPEIKPVKRHNFWLFLVLSLLTTGLFVAYWYLVLIRDPHKHFRNHVQVDDALSLAFH